MNVECQKKRALTIARPRLGSILELGLELSFGVSGCMTTQGSQLQDLAPGLRSF